MRNVLQNISTQIRYPIQTPLPVLDYFFFSIVCVCVNCSRAPEGGEDEGLLLHPYDLPLLPGGTQGYAGRMQRQASTLDDPQELHLKQLCVFVQCCCARQLALGANARQGQGGWSAPRPLFWPPEYLGASCSSLCILPCAHKINAVQWII